LEIVDDVGEEDECKLLIVVRNVELTLSAQNLLRTLTESNVKPHADLRLLLNTVKEGRVCLLCVPPRIPR
jgi:hypothetical protein